MRGQTIADELVGGTLVVVHKPVPPLASEWTVHCKEIAERRSAIRGVIVVAKGPGPDTLQREELQKSWEGGAPPPIAIMSKSAIVRGVLTALNWFMANKLKPFAETDYEGAFRYLQLDDKERAEVLAAIRRLAADLGVALAEERRVDRV